MQPALTNSPAGSSSRRADLIGFALARPDRHANHSADPRRVSGDAGRARGTHVRKRRSDPMPVKVQIIFYSTYGHIYRLAQAVAEGARQVAGADVQIFRVPETLPQEVLQKMGAVD